MEAAPAVTANRGRVAVARGPQVYAVEEADNPGRVDGAAAPPDARLAADSLREVAGLGPVVVVRLVAPGQTRETVAIPYFLWANGVLGPMRVWLRDGARLHRPEHGAG